MKKIDAVKKLWALLSSGNYTGVKPLFAGGAKIVWPTSREYYDQLDKFVEVNELFGRDWNFEVKLLEKSSSGKIISVVYATSPSWEASFYATSIFDFSQNLISNMETYWAFEDKQPDWRKGVSKVY